MTRASDRSERRERTSSQVQHMLDERQELLSLMFELSGDRLKPGARNGYERLNEFCQVLVDYIAAGHFGLYKRISDGRERRRNVADLAMKVYSRIEQSTEAVLEFNEKYEAAGKRNADLSALAEDLSRLGETLTTRMELEDQLIAHIINPG